MRACVIWKHIPSFNSPRNLLQWYHIYLAESETKSLPWHFKLNQSSDFPSWLPCCWSAVPKRQNPLPIKHVIGAPKDVSSPSSLIYVIRWCSPNRPQRDPNGFPWRLERTDSTRRERQETVKEKDVNCLRKVRLPEIRPQKTMWS